MVYVFWNVFSFSKFFFKLFFLSVKFVAAVVVVNTFLLNVAVAAVHSYIQYIFLYILLLMFVPCDAGVVGVVVILYFSGCY